MDKNNLSVQASLDTSQLKKDLDKFKGEVRLNADTKSLKKQVESVLKNMTIQPSLDTSQLKNDLGKFTGEVRLNANTTTLAKQVGATIANASQNATANIHCNLSGMDSVIGQIKNAASLNNGVKLNVSVDTSGLQRYTNQLKEIAQLSSNLQMPPINTTTALAKQVGAAIANASQNATANIHCNLSGMDSVIGQIKNATSLNNDVKLNVSVDTSGLQQYTNQLREIAQLSSNLQMPPINTTATLTEASLPKISTSAPATSIKEATTESKGFLDTLNQIASIANTPLSLFGPGGMTERYQKWGKNIIENLD